MLPGAGLLSHQHGGWKGSTLGNLLETLISLDKTFESFHMARGALGLDSSGNSGFFMLTEALIGWGTHGISEM